jgi:hypothetical protein
MFNHFYTPIIQDIQLRAAVPSLETLVKFEFVRLTTASSSEKVTRAPSLAELQQHNAPSSCFAYLSYIPSNTLTYGHQLCDTCVLKHSYSNSLGKCPLCDNVNQVVFLPKPATAGVHILHLVGEVQDARYVASMLKTLRSKIYTSLEASFDLVVYSGIGIFFAVILFCNGATIEDCVHHLGSLRNLREKRNGFSFRSQLNFSFSKLQRS